MTEARNSNVMVNTTSKLDNFLKYVLPILCLMFSIGVGYASLRDGICDNRLHLEEAKNQMSANEDNITGNKEKIITMQADVKYIKSGVDEIKVTLKNGK